MELTSVEDASWSAEASARTPHDCSKSAGSYSEGIESREGVGASACAGAGCAASAQRVRRALLGGTRLARASTPAPHPTPHLLCAA